jgi:hypothetical protein
MLLSLGVATTTRSAKAELRRDIDQQYSCAAVETTPARVCVPRKP